MKKQVFVISIVLVLTSCTVDVNNVNTPTCGEEIPPFFIEVQQERKEALLSQKLLNYEIPAVWTFRNHRYEGLLRPQGTGSRYYSAWSYTLFSTTPAGTVDASLILSAQTSDRTKIRTMLMTYLCKEYGVWAPACELVSVWLNGEPCGVYVKVERIDEYYFQNQNLPVYELIKVMCSAKFTMCDPDALYSFDWQIPESHSQTFFIEFLNALDTVSTERSIWNTLGTRYFDIPQYLRFHALNVVVNNVDGLSNNFYFYRPSPTSRYTVLTHDFDNAFSSAREVSLDAENEIIKKLLQSDSCRALYKKYLSELIEEYYTEERLYPIIDAYKDSIRKENEEVSSWDRATFDSEINQLKSHISSRRMYLRKQIELLQ